MANSLVHKVEVADFLTVETSEQLVSAIRHLVGLDDVNLCNKFYVELISETLSDGSRAFEINVRKAVS